MTEQHVMNAKVAELEERRLMWAALKTLIESVTTIAKEAWAADVTQRSRRAGTH